MNVGTWIPVEERLPRANHPVLVWCSKHGIPEVRYQRTTEHKTGWHKSGAGFARKHDITHWAEILPPTEVE